MPPRVTRLVPRAERITKQKAEEARQAILALELPEAASEAVLIAISRHATGGRLEHWTFTMLQPGQCLAVWNAIRELQPDDRPHQVRHLFDLLLTHVEINTGACTLSREELAARINTEPKHISTMMGTLERLGVVYRRRVKVVGMRGAGIARYYLNPHVAWNGALDIRQEQAQQVPLPFSVIDGGKPA